MSMNSIYKGMIIGAVAGTALALADKPTREKVSSQMKTAGNSMNYYKSRPSEAVRDFREYYERLAEDLSNKTEDVMDILSQVQETMDMVNGVVHRTQSKSSDSSSSQSD